MKSHQIHTSIVSGMARCLRSDLSHCSLVPCELSGESSDSQFCETKKVKAPLGVRVVRLGVDSV